MWMGNLWGTQRTTPEAKRDRTVVGSDHGACQIHRQPCIIVTWRTRVPRNEPENGLNLRLAMAMPGHDRPPVCMYACMRVCMYVFIYLCVATLSPSQNLVLT